MCGSPFERRTSRQVSCSPECNAVRQNTKRRRDHTCKRCRTCQLDKPIAEFVLRHRSCISCEALHEAGNKRCTCCGETKPFSEFHRRPDRKLGYDARCKACRSADSRRRNADPEKQARQRALHLAYRFGLSVDQYNDMLAAQGGVCPICLRSPENLTQPFHVDHDHRCCPGDKTCGQCLRDLLCFNCNVALGSIRDSLETAERLVTYLRRYSNEAVGP